MSNPRVQIIIDALNLANDEMKQLDQELEKLDDTTRRTGGGIDTMKKGWQTMIGVMAGVTAGVYAVKKGFDFAKEGAQLELVEGRFDRLADSIGTTGDALLADLKPAMGGMLSQAEMMASATDLMALGLVKTHDEAIRLASVAGQLNMNMNQLVLTLTNQTTMRFDALGVSVDGFKEKVEELEEAGMDANDAFKEAFLQQAEEQLERVGSAADTTAGEFARLEANIKDAGDAWKRNFVAEIAPGVELLNSFTEAQIALNEAEEQGIITTAEADKIRRQATFTSLEWADVKDILVEKEQEYIDSLDDADVAMLSYADNVDLLVDKEEDLKEGVEKTTESIEYQAKALRAAGEAALGLMGIFQNQSVWGQAKDWEKDLNDGLIELAMNAGATGDEFDNIISYLQLSEPALAAAALASKEATQFKEQHNQAVAEGIIGEGMLYAIQDDAYDNISNTGLPAYEDLIQANKDLGKATEFFAKAHPTVKKFGQELEFAGRDADEMFTILEDRSARTSDSLSDLVNIIPDSEVMMSAAMAGVGNAIEDSVGGAIDGAKSQIEKFRADFETLDGLAVDTFVNVHVIGGFGGGRTIYSTEYIRRIVMETEMDNGVGTYTGTFGQDIGQAGVGIRHSGGPVEAGRPYIWKPGEELLVPEQDGTVIPNNKVDSSFKDLESEIRGMRRELRNLPGQIARELQTVVVN